MRFKELALRSEAPDSICRRPRAHICHGMEQKSGLSPSSVDFGPIDRLSWSSSHAESTDCSERPIIPYVEGIVVHIRAPKPFELSGLWSPGKASKSKTEMHAITKLQGKLLLWKPMHVM